MEVGNSLRSHLPHSVYMSKHTSRKKNIERRQWPVHHIRHGWNTIVITTSWKLLDSTVKLLDCWGIAEEARKRDWSEGTNHSGNREALHMNRTAKTDAMTILPFYSQFIYENTSDFFFLWTHLPMGFSQISFLSNGILGNKHDLSLSWSCVFFFFLRNHQYSG